MSTPPKATSQSPLAAAKQGTRRVSDAAERTLGGRNGPASLSGGGGTSLDALEGDSATSSPQYDETTHTRPPKDDESESTVLVPKDDKTTPPTPSIQNGSGVPLLQENGAVQLYPLIRNDSVQPEEKTADSHPSEEDNPLTTPEDKEAAHPPGSIKDSSASEHKVCYVPSCWL